MKTLTMILAFGLLASLNLNAGQARLQFDANNTHGAVTFFAQRKAAALEWPENPVTVVEGIGTVIGETVRNGGSITADQTANTVTLSEDFFVATDVGKVIEWDQGNSTSIIAAVQGARTALTVANNDFEPGPFRIVTQRIELVDLTVPPGTWTYRVAATTLTGSLPSEFSNEAQTEIAPFGPGSLQVVSIEGLSNLSARAYVGEDEEILIGGLVTKARTRILARGVGPGLNRLGVMGTLLDPRVTFFDKAGAQMFSNDNWGGNPEISAAAEQVFAFKLDPMSTDSALLVELDPGQYTVHLTGVGGGTGVALLELYTLP